MKTRKIGFLDYDLNNYHANVYSQLLKNDLKDRGYEVSMCWAMKRESGEKWAAEKKIPFVRDPREMSECDALMVLAPANPETHLPIARLALPLKLPTYIDKTFAPDHATARKIFALADKHRVPVITSSALRCCASLHKHLAQVGKKKVRHMRAWGGGRSFEEYAIHPLEMVISVMGPEIRRVMHLVDGKHHQLQLEFSGGRTASAFIHTQSACGFHAMVTTDESTSFVDCGADPIFKDLCSFILDFFDAKKEIVPRKESLMIAKVLEAVSNKKRVGTFIRL